MLHAIIIDLIAYHRHLWLEVSPSGAAAEPPFERWFHTKTCFLMCTDHVTSRKPRSTSWNVSSKNTIKRKSVARVLLRKRKKKEMEGTNKIQNADVHRRVIVLTPVAKVLRQNVRSFSGHLKATSASQKQLVRLRILCSFRI